MLPRTRILIGAATIAVGLTAWEFERAEAHAKFAAALDETRPLEIQDSPAHKRTHRNNRTIVLCDGVRRLEINGIASLGRARVEPVAKQ